MRPIPTKQEVFDALLEAYRGTLSEFSMFMKDTSYIDQEIKDWEELYRRAK